MSLYGVQHFIFRLKQDPALQKGLNDKTASTFDGFPIDEDERQALLAGDVVDLFRRGVHPLLLAPYSRFVGISPAEYKKLLAPVKGARILRS
jgi:hypothetical protein